MELDTDAVECVFAISLMVSRVQFSLGNPVQIRDFPKMVKAWTGGLSVAPKSIHVIAKEELGVQSSPKLLEVF
jgi:hypothetical protein